jgi:hypothetical protein
MNWSVSQTLGDQRRVSVINRVFGVFLPRFVERFLVWYGSKNLGFHVSCIPYLIALWIIVGLMNAIVWVSAVLWDFFSFIRIIQTLMCICEYSLVLEKFNFVSNLFANIVWKSWNYCVTEVMLNPTELIITCLEQLNFQESPLEGRNLCWSAFVNKVIVNISNSCVIILIF